MNLTLPIWLAAIFLAFCALRPNVAIRLYYYVRRILRGEVRNDYLADVALAARFVAHLGQIVGDVRRLVL